MKKKKRWFCQAAKGNQRWGCEQWKRRGEGSIENPHLDLGDYIQNRRNESVYGHVI